jgi:hypothetical protein
MFSMKKELHFNYNLHEIQNSLTCKGQAHGHCTTFIKVTSQQETMVLTTSGIIINII